MTVVRVEVSTAVHTRFTPSTAASLGFSPFCRSSSILSNRTMVLSSVMPMANAMPANEITLIVRSNSNSPRNPARVQIGMPITAIKVARAERIKPYITRVANRAPNSKFTKTF